MNEIRTIDALEMAQNNYKDYSLYVAQGRAYPALKDGLKSSYRRAIYGMYLNNTHKTVKVAELAAHALPYHPHPSSVSGVIVQLGEGGNKLKLMETQGNWGNSARDIEASADRYIGGYLSTLAESLLCDSVEYSNFIKGEIDKDEPEALPVLLPTCFINGMKGIPSGLPTLNIPTIDISGMIDYYLEILAAKDLDYAPKKFPKANYDCDIVSTKDDWNQVMLTGKGTIRFAPKMSIEGNVITITCLPSGKNIEHVRKIVEKEILLDKIDVRDESTKDISIVIEKVPHKQQNMQELYKKLYNKLQTNETFNMAFYDEDKVYVPCGFDKVVKANLNYLIATHKNRIAHQLEDLKLKLRVLEIIESLKKGNNIKPLVDMTNKEAIEFICEKYKTIEDVASKVMQKPLSYLTKEHLVEIEDLKQKIADLNTDDKDIYEFLSKKYKAIKKDIIKALRKQNDE